MVSFKRFIATAILLAPALVAAVSWDDMDDWSLSRRAFDDEYGLASREASSFDARALEDDWEPTLREEDLLDARNMEDTHAFSPRDGYYHEARDLEDDRSVYMRGAEYEDAVFAREYAMDIIHRDIDNILLELSERAENLPEEASSRATSRLRKAVKKVFRRLKKEKPGVSIKTGQNGRKDMPYATDWFKPNSDNKQGTLDNTGKSTGENQSE